MSWLYGPETLTWKVNRESVLLLGGGRALLMQLAHPLVAAGVAQHSAFPEDAFRRLRRTLDAMLGMVYGSEAEARAIARALRTLHARVRGVLNEDMPVYAAGTAYDARDPELALWVWATLVDSSLESYAAFVRALSAAEQCTYYEESKRIATLLELPAGRLPPDLQTFRAYLAEMLEGEALVPTLSARRLADAVLHPPWPLWRGAGDLLSVITVAQLPPTLRARYGLAWGRRQRLAWRAAQALVRASLPLLPDVARAMPHARRAERRLRAARSEQ